MSRILMPPSPIGAGGIKKSGCPRAFVYDSVCESVFLCLYLLNEWRYFNEIGHN